MRDYQAEFEKRIEFIRGLLKSSGAAGIVFGNSGGKDSVLVGILCRVACDNTLGVIMPCGSKQNFNEDLQDAMAVAEQFDIRTKTIDLTDIKGMFVDILGKDMQLADMAVANIPPRLRMTTLYTIAGSQNMLVAGTGNKSEIYMGYFTKWGDGAYDFNPIADLTAGEVFEFLEFLKVPQNIIKKAPSAGLFEGQTDESEMGISYSKIDDYILNGRATAEDKELIEGFHRRTEHKRKMPTVYVEGDI